MPLPFEELIEWRFLLGAPERAPEQIIDDNKRLGMKDIIPAPYGVGTPHSREVDVLHLVAEEVMPK